MRFSLALWVLAAALCISSCSALQRSNVFDSLPMLAPESLGRQVQFSQTVKISPLKAAQEASPLTLIGAWSVTTKSLNFVGLAATGQTLLKLHYQGGVLTEEYSPVLTETVPGREVLVQLQLAYWPEESIRQQFRDTNWRLDISDTVRTIYAGRRKVLMIESAPALAQPDTLLITNYAHQYQLRIETISHAVLP